MFNQLNHLVRQVHLQFRKVNPSSSKLNHLGKWVNFSLNWANLLARWVSLNSCKEICLDPLNWALKCSLVLKLHSVSRPSLGSTPNLVSKLKLAFKPNLLIKCSLDPRDILEPNHHMVSSSPKGNLKLPHIKIINSHKLTLIRIFSNHTLVLLVRLVISGLLGVKNRVKHLVTLIIPMDKTLTDKTLMGQIRPGKINGGNHELDGTLMLFLTRGLRYPSILNYLSWRSWNYRMCPN